MAHVHALALVDRAPGSRTNVTVGPVLLVGPDVTLEAGVVLESHVRVEGHTTLGRNVRVHAGAVLGGPPQT